MLKLFIYYCHISKSCETMQAGNDLWCTTPSYVNIKVLPLWHWKTQHGHQVRIN